MTRFFQNQIFTGGTSSFGPLTSDSAKRFVREIVDAQGQKVYQCTLCKMQTKHNFSMQRHMVIKHTRPSNHLCQYCQATFPNKFCRQKWHEVKSREEAEIAQISF